MKVYLVTEGDYSSYNVCGVFSTREKAKKYIKYFSKHAYDFSKHAYKGYEIEEYTLDPIPDMVYKENMQLFRVCMAKTGNVSYCHEASPDSYEPPELRQTYLSEPPELTMYVWARNRSHAIKIVSEQRRLLLVYNIWNQKKLEKILEENQKISRIGQKCVEKIEKILKNEEK